MIRPDGIGGKEAPRYVVHIARGGTIAAILRNEKVTGGREWKRQFLDGAKEVGLEQGGWIGIRQRR